MGVEYHVSVACAIGYAPDDKLVDTSSVTFRRTFGCDANAAATWIPDAIRAEHLSDHSGMGALCMQNCRY